MLWFTFKFVSLNHWKQRKSRNRTCCLSCDLLSNLYLWTIGNNYSINWQKKPSVVIYFQICIFEPLETTLLVVRFRLHPLWFTFKFVSLNHWKQLLSVMQMVNTCCDLLSNLYLWTIGNNHEPIIIKTLMVVIYFQICIFEPLETTGFSRKNTEQELWFTFKFVSLNHWKQLCKLIGLLIFCCDLLSNLYLWTIGNNVSCLICGSRKVVIYFQICIFEPLETTWFFICSVMSKLWFTFKFVSLNHWKQLLYSFCLFHICCDLLSNLYLWTIGNNKVRQIKNP